jgi:hypothetical protein
VGRSERHPRADGAQFHELIESRKKGGASRGKGGQSKAGPPGAVSVPVCFGPPGQELPAATPFQVAAPDESPVDLRSRQARSFMASRVPMIASGRGGISLLRPVSAAVAVPVRSWSVGPFALAPGQSLSCAGATALVCAAMSQVGEACRYYPVTLSEHSASGGHDPFYTEAYRARSGRVAMESRKVHGRVILVAGPSGVLPSGEFQRHLARASALFLMAWLTGEPAFPEELRLMPNLGGHSFGTEEHPTWQSARGVWFDEVQRGAWVPELISSRSHAVLRIPDVLRMVPFGLLGRFLANYRPVMAANALTGKDVDFGAPTCSRRAPVVSRCVMPQLPESPRQWLASDPPGTRRSEFAVSLGPGGDLRCALPSPFLQGVRLEDGQAIGSLCARESRGGTQLIALASGLSVADAQPSNVFSLLSNGEVRHEAPERVQLQACLNDSAHAFATPAGRAFRAWALVSSGYDPPPPASAGPVDAQGAWLQAEQIAIERISRCILGLPGVSISSFPTVEGEDPEIDLARRLARGRKLRCPSAGAPLRNLVAFCMDSTLNGEPLDPELVEDMVPEPRPQLEQFWSEDAGAGEPAPPGFVRVFGTRGGQGLVPHVALPMWGTLERDRAGTRLRAAMPPGSEEASWAGALAPPPLPASPPASAPPPPVSGAGGSRARALGGPYFSLGGAGAVSHYERTMDARPRSERSLLI